MFNSQVQFTNICCLLGSKKHSRIGVTNIRSLLGSNEHSRIRVANIRCLLDSNHCSCIRATKRDWSGIINNTRIPILGTGIMGVYERCYGECHEEYAC